MFIRHSNSYGTINFWVTPEYNSPIGVNLHLPPFGYGEHNETGELTKVDTICRAEINKIPKSSDKYIEYNYFNLDVFEELSNTDNIESVYTTSLLYAKKEIDPKTISAQSLDEMIRSYIKNKERINKYISVEWRRRLYGLWYMIKDKWVYIPGRYYYFLRYKMSNNRNLKFIMWQNQYFCCINWAFQNPNMYGVILSLKRGGSKTTINTNIVYEFASRTPNTEVPIQVDDDQKVKEIFRLHILDDFENSPFFFKPDVNELRGALSDRIDFINNKKRGKKDFQQTGLKTYITSLPPESSKDGAIKVDSKRLKLGYFDEQAKVHNINQRTKWNTVKYCFHGLIEKKLGIAIYSSTTELGVSYSNDYTKLLIDSDPTNINFDDGEVTNTQLVWLFVPYYLTSTFDKYGFPDNIENEKIAHTQAIKRQLDDRAILEIRVKNPETRQDVLNCNITNNSFKAVQIAEVITDLQSLPKDYFIKGYFKIKKYDNKLTFYNNLKVQGNGVEFIEVTDDEVLKNPKMKYLQKFSIIREFYLSYTSFLKKFNILPYSFNNDRFTLNETTKNLFLISTDPYQKNTGKSKCASLILYDYTNISPLEFKRQISVSDKYSNSIICSYCNRPNTHAESVNDMVLSSLFFGCTNAIEYTNDGGMINTIINDTNTGYNLKEIVYKSPFEQNYGVKEASNKTLINNSIIELGAYFDSTLGFKFEKNSETGEEELVKYPTRFHYKEILSEALLFDPENTEEFHYIMALMNLVRIKNEINMSFRNIKKFDSW